MKKDIHPKVYNDCKVTCVCGNTFTTISTEKEIRVEICYMCHPLYTGEQRIVDTAGRVETFEKRMQLAKKRKKQSKKAGNETKTQRPMTLKETMAQIAKEYEEKKTESPNTATNNTK